MVKSKIVRMLEIEIKMCRSNFRVVRGANSVVKSDIPDNVVVAGVPAKIIKVNKESIV